MTRVVVLTFSGKKRWDDQAHPHESPSLMWIPMVLLSVGSVASGYLLSKGSALVHWLAPVVNPTSAEGGKELMRPIVVSELALGVVILGVFTAIVKYGKNVSVEAPNGSALTRFARRDLGQDDFNHRVLVLPGQAITKGLVAMDFSFIDGVVRAVGWVLSYFSQSLKKVQNGYVRSYALLMTAGAIALLATIWLVTL
jgi:NADH-quinone oxidoreductase subunit L